MDTTSLQPLIHHFLETQSSDPSHQEHQDVHQRRAETARQLLQLDRIPDLTRDQLEEFLRDTDAWYGVRGRQRLFRELFGENDERLPTLKDTLTDLVRRAEAGLTAPDFNELRDSLPWVGSAYLSEILALRFPDRYWVWNKPVREFLAAQGIDVKASLPWGKKGDEGEQYLAAGQHLADLRRALSEAAGRPSDYLFVDLFVYWANRQEKSSQQPDRWAERIARWQREDVFPERLQARQEGEARARALLEDRLGQFDESDLRQFLADLSADFWNDKLRADRFMPALYGAQVNKMAETLDAFNLWVERIWRAEDAELDNLLNEFWTQLEVSGAGVSLPTALLYLRDAEQYNIWLPVMSKGLGIATGFEPGKWRTARAYRRYNTAIQDFRAKYQLSPQTVDVILWKITRSVEPEPAAVTFPGFTEDTFRFLRELAANNSAEWMHQDNDANELRYRSVLREPLRSLFKAVAPTVAEIDPTLETQAKYGKVLAGIKKRWPDEQGPYHPYLWGAFYRRGYTKQTDAQLFVIVGPDHVNVGLCVAGAQGSEILTRFRRNLQRSPDLFLQLLNELPDDIHVAITERHGLDTEEIVTIRTQDDLELLSEVALIDIERRYPSDAPILLEPEFADEVAELFQVLHPLFRFATTEEPEALVDLASVEIEDEPEELYQLEQLCDDTFLETDFWEEVEFLIRDKKQVILYGPPGTGKTWVAQQFARYWVDAAAEPGGAVETVQFHPSYAYEEFVEGIRPQSVEGADGRRELSYPVRKGLFRRFCDQARTHLHRRYVLILDELNRGELPRILGELLYLLEYRRKSVTLPYSGEPFTIPANVYLIGTMNTADRSIALVDHALRRRFHFVQMRSSSDVLRFYFESQGDPGMAWTADLLDLVNSELDKEGIEWHLHIGHSHFMQFDLDETRLRLIWKHSVMPTLEEYFYRQPERLESYQLSTLRAALGKT